MGGGYEPVPIDIRGEAVICVEKPDASTLIRSEVWLLMLTLLASGSCGYFYRAVDFRGLKSLTRVDRDVKEVKMTQEGGIGGRSEEQNRALCHKNSGWELGTYYHFEALLEWTVWVLHVAVL